MELSRQTHPTVYEILVGDWRLMPEDLRERPRGLHARMARAFDRHRKRVEAQRALWIIFDNHPDRGLEPSTTLAGLTIGPEADGEPVLHLTLDNGRRVKVVIMSDRDKGVSYAIGYQGYQKADEWLWTSEFTAGELQARTRKSTNLVSKLKAKPL